MLLLQTNPEVWWNVFRLAAALYFISGIFYVIFSSGITQNWNNSSKTSFIDGKIFIYLEF